MTNSIEQMSSEELFQLAKSRQMEEAKSAREELKSELDALRKERRELVSQHKKDISQIDDKIEKIRSKMSPNANTLSAPRNPSTNISAAVLNTLKVHQQMSTKALQAELANNGIVASNLSQTLAYLKRQGKINSPERAVYAIA